MFKGKSVLITGGTSGIGRTTAIEFARHGAKVTVSGRRADEGSRTVELIQQAGGSGRFVRGDVTSARDVQAMVNAAIEHGGRLDAAFNNAGIEEIPGPFLEHDESIFDKVMTVNVKGMWLCLKAEIAAMLKTGGGSIVNNASIAGLIGFPGAATYCASKFAVIGYTKTLALEFAKLNIRVNAVAPAAIQTEMIDRFAADDQTRDYLKNLHPIGRIGTPEEIASGVLWLCSSGASFTTGHVLTIDGGFTAQ